MRRIYLTGVAMICALAGCGGGDDSGDDQQAPGRDDPLLGVTAGALLQPEAQVAEEMKVMAEAGVTTLRVPFYWNALQPYRSQKDVPPDRRDRFSSVGGRPTDFTYPDEVVEAASRENIVLLPIALGTPEWAARNPDRAGSAPAGTEAYSAYMKALIGRYGPDGSFWSENEDVPKRPVRDWQLWNEPDRPKYWAQQPYARDYVRLARAARGAIKEADSGARVVMAGFAERSWEQLDAVYRAGAKGVFDVAAIHPYTYEISNVVRIIRYGRRELRQAGDGDRPLWLTEVTWSSGRKAGNRRYPFETTRADQAARLSRALPLLVRQREELGVDRIYWENWISTDRDRSNPFNFSGLRVLNRDGSVEDKPALDAYRRVAGDVKADSGT